MSRRGGGRASEPRRDQPSPAAPRGGGGRGRGRGRGAPAPTESAPAPTQPPPQRASPDPSPAVAQSQPPPPQRTAPATQEAASSSATPKAESLAGEMSKLTVSEASPPAPPPSSTRSVRFPARPGYGRAGTNCLVLANHFLVQVAATDLCHYDVTISPEITSKAINREIVKLMSKTFCESHLGSKKIAYDGMKSVYTAGELPFSSKEFAVKLPDKDGQGGSSKSQTKKRGGDREFKVVIKFASKPDIHHLAEFLRGRQRDIPQETIQALDVVLRQAPSEKYTVVGRSLFDVSLGGKGELGNGLEFWKGYYQSLRPTQMGLSLNIDVSARAFYEAIPLVDYLAKYLNLRTPSKPWTDQERLKVRKALKGIRVASQHLGHTKTYKVSGISVEPLNKLMFTLDEGGQKISVAQYFKQKYKIPIMYGSWPAIQAGSAAKPVSIPIEVCKIVSGQRYSRKLNEVQVRNLLRATCQRPVQRAESINTIVKSNKYNDVEVIRQFGLHIKEELTPVEARVLPPPTIMYHGTGRTATESPRLGQWNMIDKKMINGGKVDYWGCVNFSGWGDDSCYLFCEDLISMCSSRGMVFKLDPLIPIYSSTPTEIENTLVRIHRESSSKILQMSGQKDRPLQLLIVLLPEISGFYGKIKKVCETELGIVTQCCQTKKAEKGGKQYLENLSLKINVKVGGRNSVLQDAVKRNIPFVTDVPTIIFGADVTHPQPGEDSSPSIAAVVASMDWPEVSKYRGLVMAQTHRQELIEDLYTSTVDSNKGVAHGGMIRDHLLAFFRSTNQKPKRIIFYRDGVSEGQFSQVLLHEMDAIRKACSSLQGDYLPPVTFVVVQKRHHTRLFPYDSRKHGSTDRSGNILPGTVVDTKICHPSEFDFYLNSHAGIQGTSRPAHYHVLYDENKFSADALQVLTNNLCYTYARCTRSVSIVPPAYYAHLAAFRARYYIEGDASDAGSSSGGAGGPQRIQTLPVIKDCVKEVMFYC